MEGSASAAGTCSGPISNYFDGYTAFAPTGESMQGIAVKINAENAALCRPVESQDFYAVWTMIAGAGDSGYSQAGYQYYAGQPNLGNWSFAQANTCDKCTAQSVYNYSYYGVGSSAWKFFTQPYGFYLENGYIANGTAESMQVTGVDSTYVSPWDGQSAAEMGHLQSDVPGTSSAPVDFLNTQYEVNGSYGYGNYGSLSPTNDNPTNWFQQNPPFSYPPDPYATDFGVYSYSP
jgi:hypothetical protein